MSADPKSLRSCCLEAEQKRRSLETFPSTISDEYQDQLGSTISLYEECLKLVDAVALFSPNESLEDISSSDIQYLLLRFQLAELLQKSTRLDRKQALSAAQSQYRKFLKLLDQYDILSKADSKLFEMWADDPQKFSTASVSDAVARRDTKIRRFKEEKELRTKLEYLQQNPRTLENDDEALRALYLANIQYAVHMTFQSLESIAQEMQILALAPPTPPQDSSAHIDPRERGARDNGYSERLDAAPLRNWMNTQGPILDKNGRPLKPFTLLDTRQRMRDGVFRPDHSLPTMTIDEYLEEERKRGGIIEGGGAQSGIRPEPDEDNYVKGEEETMKARAWDEFKEANPKGSGNTMNMG